MLLDLEVKRLYLRLMIKKPFNLPAVQDCGRRVDNKQLMTHKKQLFTTELAENTENILFY